MSTPRLHLDHTRLAAALARGESYSAIGRMFGCSRDTVRNRVHGAPELRCVACDVKDVEIARLRDAYMLLEEALFAFIGANRPGDVGPFLERVEYGKGQMSESSSSAAPRGECAFEERAA